jgi:radical SAM superfamily enzyme YgiQ (UPF0313 family)
MQTRSNHIPGPGNPHILFVYPPAFRMPIGTAYLVAYLVQEGFRAEQFIAAAPLAVSRCVKQITTAKPKIVGFTVYHVNYCLCQLLARGIKEADPGIIILFGGPTATVQAEVVLQNNPWVDICVRHEGEETCLELLSLLETTGYDLVKAAPRLEKIKGISYRQENRVRENPPRDLFFARRHNPDWLDKYPSPYLSGTATTLDLGIVTARGCNRHCVYCHCSVLSKRAIATHSIDRVLEELTYLAKRIDKGRVVDIFDDAFGSMPERVMEICRRIIAGKIRLPLICATRCDLVDEEFLDTLKAAGFKAVSFSLESAVPRILRILGKVQPPNTTSDPHFDREKEFIGKFKKYVLYAKKIGIEIVYSSIMLGLPTETPTEGKQTVELIRSLGKNLDLHAHNIFEVYPGTPVYFNAERGGLKLLKYDNQVHYGVIHPYDTSVIEPAPRSSAELAGIQQDKHNLKMMALCLSLPPAARGALFKKTAPLDPPQKFLVGSQVVGNIVLCADQVTGELIRWLQDSLAINGRFVQVYSNIETAKQFLRENDHALYKYVSPTMNYSGYYREKGENGIMTLVPCRTFSLGKKCGLPLHWVKTTDGLSATAPHLNPLQVLCLDRDKEDVLRFYHGLQELSEKKSPLEELFGAPIYPYIASLCRWEKRPANCQLLETLIVDSNHQIKPCWNGDTLGQVGTPLPEIVENLQRIHREVYERRGCKDCPREEDCPRCIFPAPLTEAEYCSLRRQGKTAKGAELIRSLELFKEE